MNDYDQSARLATAKEPTAVFARLAERAKLRWRFVEWGPTQTTPDVGGRDQIADRTGRLEDLDVSGLEWLALLEFQFAHVPDKLDDVLAEAAQFRRGLRRPGLALLPVLVYLTGECPEDEATLDMQTPSGHGVFSRPLIWEVAKDSAAKSLDDYEQGRIGWGILFWVALMAGADDEELVRRWLALVQALPEERQRADIKRIALVFASLARRGQLWVRILEERPMGESEILNKWRKEAADERELQVLKRTALGMLNARFPGQVTADVIETIKSQPSAVVMDEWTVCAGTARSFDEFRDHLRK